MIALILSLLAVVNVSNNSVTYVCNGVTATYQVNFPYLASTDLVVTSTTAGGSVTTLTPGTDWSVNFASTSSTATLTLVNPSVKCPNTNVLKIERKRPFTQPYGFRAQSVYNQALHETAYDSLEMQIQQVNQTALAATNPTPTTVNNNSSVLGVAPQVTRTLLAALTDFISVKNYGAKGDGAANDTASVKTAVALAIAHGAVVGAGPVLWVPAGTYLIDCGGGGGLDLGILPSPFAFIFRGEGKTRSVFKCRTAGTMLQFATQVGNNFSNGIEIDSLGFVGFGSSDSTIAHGILDNDADNGTNDLYIHDNSVTGFSGNCIYLKKEFSISVERNTTNDCGQNHFDISGGNTTYLGRNYAQTVAAGYAGYRIHGPAVMVANNGIDNVWGGVSTTGLSEDQADWLVAGNEILTAWAQTTAYTVGQIRQANGLEFECITAGTSSSSGAGPATISKNITDGTAHWREIGQADTATNFATIAMVGDNVEAFTRSGVRVKAGSAISFIGSDFAPSPGAPAGSAGLIGLWYSGAQDPQQSPSLLDGMSFANQTISSYENASPIHVTATTPAFVRIGGTTNDPLVWSRTSQLPALVSAISTTNNGATGASLFYATTIRRLSVTGAFTRARVSPTYGVSTAIDPNLGGIFDISATNGVNFTVKNPGSGGSSNAGIASGMDITICIINTSGGALGVATFDTLYKLGAAWTQPATANRRCIAFYNNGTNWYETWRSAADVAN